LNVSRFQTGPRLGPAPSPPGRKGLKKGVYLVPSFFTALNILAGFYSLMMTMSAFRFLQFDQVDSTKMRLDNAAIAIGLAVVCDILDGRVARMTKTATEIGIQLDSLADIVSFGLAPAFLA